jgi:hypothetical protein
MSVFQAKLAEKIKTYILCSKIFPENIAVCVIMWENIVQPDRSQMNIKYGGCALHTG